MNSNVTVMQDSKRTLSPLEQEVNYIGNILKIRNAERSKSLPNPDQSDRMILLAQRAIINNPKLLKYDRTSLLNSIYTAFQLGLEPDGALGQAYLIPFNGKVQLIPGYKGLIILALKTI